MEVNKLLEALTIVKPGLATKELIVQTTSFAFVGGRVVTYNDEISISHPVDNVELSGAVNAEELYSFLNKIKGQEIEVEHTQREVVLKSKRYKAWLTLKQEITLPLDEEILVEGNWHKIPEDFIELFNITAQACGKDLSLPVLTGVNLCEDGTFQAGDMKRIIVGRMSEPLPIGACLLPGAMFKEILRIKPIEMAEGNGWVHFKSEVGTIISCRIFEERYPKEKAYSFMEAEGVMFEFPKSLPKVVERAEVFSKKKHQENESVLLTVTPKNRLIVSSVSDTGRFEEEINMRTDGENFVIKIAPYLLKTIMNETLTCIVCENKLKFMGGNWECVLALQNVIK